VREVYFGPDGILAHARPGALLLDCSTIDVETARAVAAEATQRGFEMLDAPVSGGVIGAEAGTLTFMVGGDPAAFARALPILQAMGKTIVHAGPSGSGQTAKICNNMILAASMIAVCEGFALAEKLGLPAQTLFDICKTSTSQCWAMTGYCPVPGPVPAAPSNRGYKAGFTAANMLKDLRLAQQAAGATAAATPLGAAAANLYQLYVDTGAGGQDFSGIMQFLRRASPEN
jgi:3-hydroxyisobutyrate dehydrogenase